MIKTITNFLKTNQVIFMMLSVIAMIAIGWADHVTFYKVGLSILYLIPISLMVWICSYRAGFILIGVSFYIWVLAAIVSNEYHNDFFNLFAHMFIRVMILFALVLYTAKFKELLEKEKSFARTDFLTGLSNTKSFTEVAEFEIERCRRYEKVFSIVYLDCDNFKTINDTLGHKVGDQLLTTVSDAMKASFRSTDLPSRVGGDEFVILLPETDEKQALIAITRAQTLLLNKMQSNNWPVTFSIGCATYKTPPNSVDEMINAADKLMYAAKKNGKNQINIAVVHVEKKKDHV